MVFMYYIILELFWMLFLMLKCKVVVGVDGVMWDQYWVNLDGNIWDFYGWLCRGVYWVKLFCRVFIFKVDGKQWLIGIVVLEDKIVQCVVVEVLNVIYEIDFFGFFYGF